MKSLQLGDQQIPQLGQGTWNMAESKSKRSAEIEALRWGVAHGLRVIDTAEMYGDGKAETLTGEAIRGIRDQAFVVGKVLPSNASTRGTIKACEASLRRLGIDSLDLYLLHWRGRFALAETLEGFRQLQEQGKIKAWGVSNFDVDDMEELFALDGGSSCATNQVLYNLEHRGIEFDLLPWCAQHDVTITAYSPVGQGGKLLKQSVLKTIADRRGMTPAQIALSWCMRQPVLAIPKAGSVVHVEENLRATDLVLSPEELAAIDKAFPPPHRKQPLATL